MIDTSLDGSKKLTLLDHVGGSPVLFTCSRTKHSPEDYELFVRVIKMAHGYFEELALPNMPVDAQEQYAQAMKIARPLLVRLDRITGKMLVPALADGQGGMVLDAALASKQWHKDMPMAQKPLPIPELAIVFGVSDAELLRKGMQEYRTLVNDAIAEIRKAAPMVPELNLPEPETRLVGKSTLYYYPLPEVLGLDKKLLPTAGLGEKVAVLTMSQEHAVRLLTATPSKLAVGPVEVRDRPLALEVRNRPLASAFHFYWAKLVGAVSPWVEFGMDQGRAPADARDQVMTILEILQVLRSHSSATYFEDSALVTHSETFFRDLER
jgi:hypothetical protein